MGKWSNIVIRIVVCVNRSVTGRYVTVIVVRILTVFGGADVITFRVKQNFIVVYLPSFFLILDKVFSQSDVVIRNSGLKSKSGL